MCDVLLGLILPPLVKVVLDTLRGEDLLPVLGEEVDLDSQDLTQQNRLVIDFPLDLIL